MQDPTEVNIRDVRPTRATGLTFAGFLGGAVLVAVLLGQLTDPGSSLPTSGTSQTRNAPGLPLGPEPAKPIGVESIQECPVPLGGLVLGDHLQVPGSALERWDCGALKGPWSVVIRATGGHFGFHSAVVTFPVDLTGSGVPSTKPPGGMWNPGTQKLAWPMGISYAQIVGDLGQKTLEDLAAQVTVEGGKPHFSGLAGFAATAVIPFDPPLVHEMRYSTDDLGEAGIRGSGLIYTGVTPGASFETLVLEAHAKPAGVVRGQPALFSALPSGNGALAWESEPGEVTYIGTEGMATRADDIETLRVLANNGRLLTPTQWETKDRFSVKAPSG
jgi:hypothetical protein